MSMDEKAIAKEFFKTELGQKVLTTLDKLKKENVALKLQIIKLSNMQDDDAYETLALVEKYAKKYSQQRG